MKRIHLFLLLLSLPFVSEAKLSPDIDPFILISKTSNPGLQANSCEVIFRITGLRELTLSRPIVWSTDGKVDTTIVGSDHEFRTILSPGNHRFEFFYSRNYEEIFTSAVAFESGYTYVYQLHFKQTEQPIMVRKPVIYVYPEETTEVVLNMIPKGELVFSYPILPSDGWKFTAQPDGKLYFGEQSYRYLFWESAQASPNVSLHDGSLVQKNEIVSFLEKNLNEMGLTSEERADFITYWAPQMMEFNSYFIQFQFNEGCNQYAELDISPKPEKINRVYLIFKGYDFVTDNLIFIPQEIPQFDREGFDVLEWGGFELN